MRTSIECKDTETTAIGRGEERFAVPWDLSDWVDRGLLRDWINSELNTLHWDDPRLVDYLQRHPQYRPRELLTVCSYAYATGLVESEEIASQCAKEPELRRMCADYTPLPREISRFRKANRGLIRWALTQLLKRSLRERFGLGTLIPPGLRRLMEENATERLDLARHMDRAGQGA